MPLFPLPRLVLLSGALLRLHVFEPRYVQLVNDVLKGNKIFAVPMIQSQDLALDHPSLHDVAGFGMIVQHEYLPDERYNITVLGLGRILLEEEKNNDTLYRVAKGRRFHEEAEDFDMSDLMMLFTQIIMYNPALSGKCDALFEKEIQVRARINALAQILLNSADDRQKFLSMEKIENQSDFLSEKLAGYLITAAAND